MSFVLPPSSEANPPDQTEAVLSALYKRAHQIDMEFTASSYWQARFQVAFPIRDGFACLCEQSPDDNDRTRIDQIIYKVNSSTLILTQIIIIESKRQDQGTSHIKKAEAQLLDGCRRASHHGSLHFVYGLTTWRTKFRAWSFNSSEQMLEAIDGGPNLTADKRSYLDILKAGNVFETLVSLAKALYDSDVRPEAASQQDALPAVSCYDGPSHMNVDPAFDPMQDTIPEALMRPAPPSAAPYNEPETPVDTQHYVELEEDIGEGPSSSAGESRNHSWLRVKVVVESHLLHKDEWWFKDHRDRKKSVVRTEWRQERVAGKMAWVWSHGHRHYYTYQDL